jgi:head-tail adaptor
MFTATELADMRATATASLPDTCDIQAKSLTSDGQGGYSESYTTSASSVACRVKSDNIKVAELIAQGGVKLQQTYTFTFAYNRTLNKTDRLVWNSRTFEVIALFDNSWQLHKRVSCIEIT